jgi:hypothetical protein
MEHLSSVPLIAVHLAMAEAQFPIHLVFQHRPTQLEGKKQLQQSLEKRI